MNTLVLLALVAGLPVLMAIIFRVNSVFLFTSIATGYLLQQFMGESTALTLRTMIRHDNIEMISALILLAVPVVFTLLLMRKTLPTKELFLHIFLLAGCGLTIATLVIKVSPDSVMNSVRANPISETAYRASDIIVSVTGTLAMLMMWATLKHKRSRKKH